MSTYLYWVFHDGSGWFLLACLAIFVGVVYGLFTDKGSGIAHHPYARPGLGGELASDLPPESLGRVELEPVLMRRRPSGPRPRARTRTRA
jgi:hypothetical protein